MFPSNSYMEPYFSQNKEQVPYHPSYPFYPYPVPSRPDPSSQPASYAPWPYHFNPMHSNGYLYPPGYYGSRPPFPYELPPPNGYSYPPGYHPYFPPMPNYPAKYPQVDPTTSQTHCCGCPNHVCHGTHNSKVKIDEEKPDADQTKMPNNTCPFFWFSPRNKVQQDEIDEPKKERKESQFPWPIVWMPEDEIKEEKKKDTQFPWPIIWMTEDDAKEKDQHAIKRASEEAAKPSFRIIPLKCLEHAGKDQDEMQKLPVVEKKQGAEEAGKEWTKWEHKGQNEVKRIPVMEKKESSEKVAKEPPVKESTGGKVTEKKHSKLPPVCLRLDPLPHKRQTNGSSKEDKNKKEVKVVDVKSAKDERKQREIEVKKDIKENLPERKNDDVKRVIMPEEDKIKKEIKVADGRGEEGKELKEREIQGEDLKDKLKEGKVESVKKSQISEQDAAVLIQSVYRGYNVRRWDPLEKLKKIRSVHEKAQELLGKLQQVEESAIQLEKKEQLVLGESIMNLLLQLDTIQGLHPIVREARKSVARELVSLQLKLDSLEKRKALETQTNEAPQPQLEVEPTATTVSSEGCKLVSEQVKLQPSEMLTMECMTTRKEDEEAHDSLKEADSEVKPNVPQSATDFHPVEEILVKDEEDSSGTTQESQMTPLVEEAKPTDLLPESVAGENYPEAQLCPAHTENSRDFGSTENAELNSSELVPSVNEESITAELAPAVTLSESSTAASRALSESEMHDTAVTSSITEEIHDTEIAPGVAMTDGVDTAAPLSETKDPDGIWYEEEARAHATESDSKETAPEVTLSETASMETVELIEESHGSDAGASMETVELQETEDGKPSNEEIKVEDHDIASDDAVTASPEVKMHATEVLLESHVNDRGANAEKVELLATDADKVEEENKSVEENKVTSLPENENSEGFQKLVEVNEPEAEVQPNVIQTNTMEILPEVEVTDHASEVNKLSLEEKKLVEENEKLRDMLEKLMEAGRNQLDVISRLNERVKGLEKKLERKSKKSKVRVKKHKPVMAS